MAAAASYMTAADASCHAEHVRRNRTGVFEPPQVPSPPASASIVNVRMHRSTPVYRLLGRYRIGRRERILEGFVERLFLVQALALLSQCP